MKLLKKSLVIILSGVMMVGSIAHPILSNLIIDTKAAENHSVTTIGSLTFYVYEDHAEMVSCKSNASGTIEVPDTVNGVKVTSIGSIEEGRISLSYNAFAWCADITTVVLPDSIEYVCTEAFKGCASLKAIEVSDNNDVFSSDDGVLLNNDYGDLVRYPPAKEDKLYKMPEDIQGIGFGAFQDCTYLSEISLSDHLLSIGANAFENCALLSNIEVPNSVLFIDSSAFKGCKALRTIILSDGLTDIGFSAFENCESLTEISIPNTVTVIGQEAFKNCKSLTSVDLSNSITEIQPMTFDECAMLSEVTIPDSVVSIGFSAFFRCSSLEEIIIPDSVTAIDFNAFQGCTALTSVRLSDSLSEISNGVFRQCSKLDEIILPPNIEVINDYAFAECHSLKRITIPRKCERIRSAAFATCNNLEAIIIQNPNCDIYGMAYTICNYMNGTDFFNNDAMIYEGTIYGYNGSTAQKYAEMYGYSFTSLGDPPAIIRGDINNDGTLGVSDVVLLQKWLLAVPDTHLANWKAADLYEDDRLDVFDLCMMKRELIYG